MQLRVNSTDNEAQVPPGQTAQSTFVDQINAIRELIDEAEQREGETISLVERLHERSGHLHSAINLPEETAALLLADFVVRYIEHVPDFIEALHDMASEAGIREGIEPLLNIAIEYFLNPPDLIAGHSALELLLDEAYLAHRLLEEINDRFIGLCGAPLVPMDMTRANLVAHELIGEPFANELDQAVLFSAELLLSEYNFRGEAFDRFFARHREHGWSVELSRWPCLATDRAIFLNFEHR